MKQSIKYFIYPFRVILYIPRFKLGKYLILSLFLTLVSSLFLILGLYFLLDSLLKAVLQDFLMQYVNFYDYLLPVLNILLAIQMFFLFIVFYRILAQLLILPFLEPLRKELEKKYNISPIKNTTLKQDIKNLFYGLYKSFIYVVIYIFLLIISIFLGPFQSIILFLYDSYIIGKGIFDVYFEKDYPEPKQREQFLKTKKIPILLTGIACTIILFIPIFGILLSAICGYTAVFLNENKIKI